MTLRNTIICILIATGSATAGLPADSTQRILDKHFLLLPVIYRSPETRLALGAALSFTFKTRKSDSLSRTSNIQVLGLRTLRKQSIAGIEGVIYFPKEHYIFRFHGSYSDYPDKFWGLGNNTQPRKVENYAYTQAYIFPQLLRKVHRHFFTGLSLEYQRLMSFKYKHGGILDSARVLGTRNYTISGLGLILSWDSRNNAFSSTAGSFVEFSATDFNNSLGSNFNYTNYIIDARKYFMIRKKDVLAFQGYGNFNTGKIPFISLAALGGGSIMRGYYSGRFRDHNLVAAQTEYRLQIVPKFGIVGFVGAGMVTRSIAKLMDVEDKRYKQITDSRFKLAGGGGVRVSLKEKERLNLRLDFGFARKSSGVYITIAEAF